MSRLRVRYTFMYRGLGCREYSTGYLASGETIGVWEGQRTPGMAPASM